MIFPDFFLVPRAVFPRTLRKPLPLKNTLRTPFAPSDFGAKRFPEFGIFEFFLKFIKRY